MFILGEVLAVSVESETQKVEVQKRLVMNGVAGGRLVKTVEDYAKWYTDKGWKVTPIHGVKASEHGEWVCDCSALVCPHAVGKTPKNNGWQKNGICSSDEIKKWFGSWDEYLLLDTPNTSNIAVLTGEILVVDVDAKKSEGVKNGMEAWAELVATHGEPVTFKVKTGGGGWHYYFEPHEKIIKGINRLNGTGIDTKAHGGCVIAPPSLHVSGNRYAVVNDLPLAEIPEWLAAWILQDNRYTPRDTGTKSAPAVVTTPGTEYAKIEQALGFLSADFYEYDSWIRIGMAVKSGGEIGLDDDKLFALFDQWSAKGQGYDPNGIRSKWDRFNAHSITLGTLFHHAKEAGMKLEAQLADPIEAARNGHPILRTDSGNASRFAFHWQGKFRYDHTGGFWRIWDGRKWTGDTKAQVMEYAKLTAKKIWDEVKALPDGYSTDDKEDFSGFAIGCEQRSKLTNMVELASSVRQISSDINDYDKDEYIFYCGNGVIDLKAGILREHRAIDYNTMSSQVDFISGFKSSKLQAYLDHATGGDKELLRYLQKATGYSLSGDNTEKIYFFFYGTGDTGKSTYLAALRTMGGEYATTIDFETLTDNPKNGDGATPVLASLKGKRIVTCSEIAPGRKINAGLLKNITGGGDLIRARHLYGNSFEYKPEFKIWIGANSVPAQDATDKALWNRTRRIPFDKVVKHKDPSIIRDFASHKSDLSKAFLAWAVEGYLLYMKEGLADIPKAIQESTSQYQVECDPLAEFMEDYLTFGPQERIANKELLQAYDSYCAENDIKYTMSIKTIGDRLVSKGCKRGMSNGNRYLTGVGLKGDTDTPSTIGTAAPCNGWLGG